METEYERTEREYGHCDTCPFVGIVVKVYRVRGDSEELKEAQRHRCREK